MTIRTFNNITPNIADTTYIDEMALVLGDVEIGEDCSFWPFTVARGDVNRIRIGDRTNIQDNSVLHVTHDSKFYPGGYALTIGSDVTVGHRVILHGCTVNDYCLIGMGATIMDGAVIEPYTLIGAGSLVAPGKHLEGGCLYIGSPARKKRALTEEERTSIQYSAQHYVNLKNRHLNPA